MPFLESVRLALNTIRVQKLKSFFTLLGVMIGVMFLIAVVSIVQGMSNYVENDFAAKIIGVNTFTFRRRPNFNPNTTDDQYREFQRRPRIYVADAELVRSVQPIGNKSAIVNQSFIYASTIYARPRQAQVIATEASYFDIKKLVITSGRAFTAQEVSAGAKVIVIGTDIVERQFGELDPLGRELRIGGMPYTIIGVLEKQGSVFGFSLDRMAIVPWTTPVSRIIQPKGDLQSMIVQGSSRTEMQDGIESAREVMRGVRHLPPGKGRQLRAGNRRLGARVFCRTRKTDDRLRHGAAGDRPRGGRDGDHEHHAGRRRGAHARDRYSQGAWRKAQ
jgi:putative ABC transport system permease protein